MDRNHQGAYLPARLLTDREGCWSHGPLDLPSYAVYQANQGLNTLRISRQSGEIVTRRALPATEQALLSRNGDLISRNLGRKYSFSAKLEGSTT